MKTIEENKCKSISKKNTKKYQCKNKFFNFFNNKLKIVIVQNILICSKEKSIEELQSFLYCMNLIFICLSFRLYLSSVLIESDVCCSCIYNLP